MIINNDLKQHIKPLRGAWLTVLLLFVVGFLNYLDRIMLTTMRGSIVEAIPMTDAQFGLLTSVFLWVYGLLSPYAGYLADRFSRSRVIIVSLFIWSAVTWLTAHAQNFEQLLATRALMGISEACYIPAALALISDYHRGNTRSLATGVHNGGIMIGQSMGFLGGWIAENHHWSDAFTVFGAFGILYAVVMFFTLKDTPDRRSTTPDDRGSAAQKISFLDGINVLFKGRNFILLVIFWGLLGVVGWMIVGWLPTYYKEHFNLSQTMAGVYATWYVYPFSFVGVILGGILADRWHRKNNYARILLPAVGLLIAAPAAFIAGSTSIMALAIGGFMVYALTRTFTDTNLMPILCMVSDEKYRATGYGILNMFACIVGGLGIYAGGILRDASVNTQVLFKIAGITMILCALLLFMIKGFYARTRSSSN
ncbi:MFS transporter [Niabella beijingensis]|uniref:MFS transporter n=1 Tax=Niabella beijingensis TaxID=2872700 RepID=UPI001CBAE8D2|nr:MFS transporter [Niabella beijingensis]MBZ4190891.1 MFS transporter [Niabella beijingensis]